MVKNTGQRSRRSTVALNTFAVLFALLPLLTMSLWTYQQFFSESRQTIELATIAPADAPQLFVEPLISVTFDDGWESIYTEAAPVMSRMSIPSTQYILPGQFNAPSYMSANQALSMKQAGHEITSHTYSHKKLTTVSEAEVVKQLDDSISVLEKLNLIDDSYRTFAAPNGALDSVSRRHVMDRFALARNVNGDLAADVSDNDMNVADQFNNYDVIGYTVGQYTTIDQLRQAIAYAKEYKAWFVPVYHQIDDSGEDYSVNLQQFKSHMKLFKSSGIKLVTMRQVVMHNQEYMQ